MANDIKKSLGEKTKWKNIPRWDPHLHIPYQTWSWRHSPPVAASNQQDGRPNAHACNRAATSAATRLKEIYQVCVGKGCWVRLVRVTNGGVETYTFSCRMRSGGPGTRGDVRHGQREVIRPLSLESLQQQQPHCYLVFILVIYLFLIPNQINWHKNTLLQAGKGKNLEKSWILTREFMPVEREYPEMQNLNM